MNRPGYIPVDYPRIKVVSSLSAVFDTPYDPANCIIMPRRLGVDFNALARRLGGRLGLDENKKAQRALIRSDIQAEAGHAGLRETDAARIIERDMAEIQERGLTPLLRVVATAGYDFKIAYDFHEDREKKTEIGRILCCYMPPVTEGLRNEDALRKNKQTYTIKPGAISFHFAPGDIWKHADRGQKVEPFIHRAGRQKPDDPPRLLLVAD